MTVTPILDWDKANQATKFALEQWNLAQTTGNYSHCPMRSVRTFSQDDFRVLESSWSGYGVGYCMSYGLHGTSTVNPGT